MGWALDQSVFQDVVVHIGLSPVIDLLATPLNSKLPVFISPFLDPQHLVSMHFQSLGTCSG